MNRLQKSICGVVAGVTLTTLMLSSAGCNKSEREVYLEQQVAGYQQKEDKAKKDQELIAAVKAGVDASNQTPDPQIAAFYNKVSEQIAALNQNVTQVSVEVSKAKEAQGSLEAAINQNPAIPQVPSNTPYIVTNPWPVANCNLLVGERLRDKKTYTIPAMSMQQLVDRLDCYGLEELNSILNNPFGSAARLREKWDRTSSNGEGNRMVVNNGTYGGSAEIYYQSKGGQPISVLKILIDSARLDGLLSNPLIYPRVLYADTLAKSK